MVDGGRGARLPIVLSAVVCNVLNLFVVYGVELSVARLLFSRPCMMLVDVVVDGVFGCGTGMVVHVWFGVLPGLYENCSLAA